MTHASKVKAVIQFNDGEVFPYDDVWDNALARGHCIKVTGKEAQTLLQDRRRKLLTDIIKPGDTVYTCTVQENGNTTHHKLFVTAISEEGRTYIRNVTRDVADFVGFRLSPKTGGIIMGGYGYSRSFQIVYDLGRALWPTGTDRTHGVRNGVPDSDGGYALKQQGL